MASSSRVTGSRRRPLGAPSSRLWSEAGSTQRVKPRAAASEVARLGRAHAADLPREADLAEGRQVGGQRLAPVGRSHGEAQREVQGGLVELHAAHHVHEEVPVAEGQVRRTLEHGRQELDPVPVQPEAHALGEAEGRGAREGLDLEEERPRALDRHADEGARHVQRAVREERGRGVLHLAQALARHLQQGQLGGGAEAVFLRPEHLEVAVLLPLQVEHRVHHVLQRLGARDHAVLRDVARP